MLDMFKTSWNDKLWRLSLFCILLWGIAIAGFIPYHSIIAIELLGFSEFEFAAITIISALVSMAVSVLVGVYTDQTNRYREVLMVSLAVGTLGTFFMFLMPVQWVFIVVHVMFLPLAGSAFTQFFALAKLAANKNPELDPDFSSSAIRAAFAGIYAFAPPIWGILVVNGVELFTIYGASAFFNLLTLAFVMWQWPKNQKTEESKAPKVSFFKALTNLASPKLSSRLALIGIITSSTMLYNMVLGLIILNQLGGTAVQIGWFAGVVALIEVPVMLFGSKMLRYVTKPGYLLIGMVFYAAFLGGFSILPSIDYLWWLLIPAALGAGILLTMTIGYVQDLVSDRPGAGGALIAITNVGGKLVASSVFAYGAAVTDYIGTAMIGGGIALLAGLVLVMIDGGKILRDERLLAKTH